MLTTQPHDQKSGIVPFLFFGFEPLRIDTRLARRPQRPFGW